MNDEKVVYKVVSTYGNRAYFSVWASSPFWRIRYRIGEWVTATETGLKHGYFPLAFETQWAAEQFMQTEMRRLGSRLFAARGRGFIKPIPPSCFLWADQLKITNSDWPSDTVMVRELKLLAEIPVVL